VSSNLIGGGLPRKVVNFFAIFTYIPPFLPIFRYFCIGQNYQNQPSVTNTKIYQSALNTGVGDLEDTTFTPKLLF
jgi:hypothetical protein